MEDFQNLCLRRVKYIDTKDMWKLANWLQLTKWKSRYTHFLLLCELDNSKFDKSKYHQYHEYIVHFPIKFSIQFEKLKFFHFDLNIFLHRMMEAGKSLSEFQCATLNITQSFPISQYWIMLRSRWLIGSFHV